MVAAYGIWFFIRQLGLSPIASIAITVPAVTLLGLLSYQFLLNRVRQHPQVMLLMTIAIAMLFQEIMVALFGSHLHASPPLIAGSTTILGVTVTNQQLLLLGVVVVVMVSLWLFLSKTKLGTAIRATAQDAEVANLMGISVPRTLLITMGIGTALAAVAATVMASVWVFFPYAWMSPLSMVLAIVVLGGLGSLKGSIIGAFIIALVETLVIFLLPEQGYMKMAFALLAMVIILVVRPGGLFGVVFEEERL
jgi:branched-chain amino acid transport system permease protein